MSHTRKTGAYNNKAMKADSGIVCGFCGAHIAGGFIAPDGGAYCCEGCLLKEKEFRVTQEERDNAYLALAETLAAALDIRERETGLHSKRVACHTMVLAKHYTDDSEQLRQVYWGSLMHDIGKIGIRDAILNKEGPLTEEEWVEMREHPAKGHSILSSIQFMKDAADIVLCHEERYDGTGYPRELRGEAIPWGARIFAIIDTLDAMTSNRPYRKALPFESAREEIIRMAGSQFDPEAVETFVSQEKTIKEMVDMKCQKPHGGTSGKGGG